MEIIEAGPAARQRACPPTSSVPARRRPLTPPYCEDRVGLSQAGLNPCLSSEVPNSI